MMMKQGRIPTLKKLSIYVKRYDSLTYYFLQKAANGCLRNRYLGLSNCKKKKSIFRLRSFTKYVNIFYWLNPF